MNSRVLKCTLRFMLLASVVLLPVAMYAQSATKPVAKTTKQDPNSKWDIFAGYSYLKPSGTVTYLSDTGTPSIKLDGIKLGGIGSLAYFFNKNVGLQFEGDFHTLSEEVNKFKGVESDNPLGGTDANVDLAGASAGIIYRIPRGNLTPFVHALMGAERGGTFNSPVENWGPVMTLGGGLDYNFSPRFSWRVAQIDYQYIHEKFALAASSNNINAVRISTGIVFHAGSVTPPPPVTIACSANPTSVFPGEPVTVTATAGSLNPKWHAIYSWSGEGVTGSGTKATVATGSLQPGTYKVICGVKEGKPGKEGRKPGQSAESSATYTVKPFEPPTISCSANPTTIKPGGTSEITATAVSPQNLPLTYSYSVSAGSISGTGDKATYNSAGAPTGAVEVTCKVKDNKDHEASSHTTLTIVAPYVPPKPHTQALCSISFDHDRWRPTRVDNQAKACLDQVAMSLQQQSNAKAVLVGESTAKEKAIMARREKYEARRRHPRPVIDPAAQRAVNAKEYLVKDKGIDASRISVATSQTDGKMVEDYLVPAGANFTSDVQGTTPVNEAKVKAIPRRPLPRRRHHVKKAK